MTVNEFNANHKYLVRDNKGEPVAMINDMFKAWEIALNLHGTWTPFLCSTPKVNH